MIKPYYSEPGITIYHGDCRDILPHLPKVDLVLTDPPYGLGFDYGTNYKDSPDAYISMLWPILEAAESKARALAVFQAAKYAPKYGEWFPRSFRLIALPKEFGQWMPSRVQHRTDYVLYWENEKFKKWDTLYSPRDWFISKQVCVTNGPNRRPDHPCPRPLDTMRFLVDILCPRGGTVLDPFMGSGTTLLAAKQLGRNSIGIEIEEKFVRVAIDRLRQEVLPLTQPSPKQEQEVLL